MSDPRDMTTGEAETYARGRRDGYAEAIRDYGAKWGAGDAWRPIETAEIDGTMVLLWSAETGVEVGESNVGDGTWQSYFGGDLLRPTLWMPIPEIPENARARPAEAAAAPGGGGLPAGAAGGAGGPEIGQSERVCDGCPVRAAADALVAYRNIFSDSGWSSRDRAAFGALEAALRRAP